MFMSPQGGNSLNTTVVYCLYLSTSLLQGSMQMGNFEILCLSVTSFFP